MAKTVDEALFKITPQIQKLSEICEENNAIDKELFTKYEVKRGLRDLNGKGVLAGLTNVSDVHAKEIIDGKEVPCPGSLYYRGYNIKDLVNGFLSAHHFGFEEIAYLLLFGELPTKKQLEEFHDLLVERRTLPPNFVRDVIMKASSPDMMNSISRSILQLYSYDEKADDTSIPNVLRQCLNLISQFPMLMVYGYHAYNYKMGEDLFIYAPKPELSTAENILMMLREDRKYTELEAKILDMALVLHMDHGGGNNSTFTTHVVEKLAKEKGYEKEYALYELVERLGPQVIGEKRKIYKGVNANVDFYSGLVYSMLGLPPALYTPIFAAARVVGWSAHRLEELKNVDKIIRPAYKALAGHKEYVKLEDR